MKKYRCGFCGYRAARAILCPRCLARTNGSMKSRLSVPVKLESWKQQDREFHYVQDDIKEFLSPDGRFITGRTAWREHLNVTGAIEMGHSDIQSQEQQWNKRRGAFQEKVASGRDHVREVIPPDGEIKPTAPSQISVEMANRLYNRPMPDRKTLIKMAIDTAKDLARRR